MERLIIDTDTAGDDCVSLLIALRSPEVTVEAITINCGNVAFDQEVENALFTLEVAGYGGKVPVYPGCRHPLIYPHKTVEYVHGRDGMGDSFFPKAVQRPEKEHAVNALIRLINENPGQLTIIAQAPLTNIAMATRLDPSIVGKVKHLWVMGGTNNYMGNDTPAAEYNVWCDPEAAKIVFTAGYPLTMVGWDICCRHAVLDDAATAEIVALDTPLSRFFLDINRVVRTYVTEKQGMAGTTHPDAIVAAMVVDPAIMTKSARYYVDVELCGQFARGYTVVDQWGKLEQPANTRVCLEADGERFRQVLMRVLSEA